MVYGKPSKNLETILSWRADIAQLYPVEDRYLHMQMWWIRWGVSMFSNIPFWSCVDSDFMCRYIYEIPKKINAVPFLPLYELMHIICDEEDREHMLFNYVEFMHGIGINKYFGKNLELKIIIEVLFGLRCDELEYDSKILANEHGVIDVVLVGNVRDDTGLGVDKVTIRSSLECLGLNVVTITNEEKYKVRSGILFLAMSLPSVYIHYLNDSFALSENAVNIAHTPWELDKIPSVLQDIVKRLDLVFYQSEYVKQSYITSCPFPLNLYYLTPIIDVRYSSKNHENLRSSFLNRSFNVITPYDLSSYQTRKNPFASINAYIRAFPYEGDVSLCIKVNSMKYEAIQYQQLLDFIKNTKRTDIWVSEGFENRDELLSFYSQFDCLLHLHRSEGFGRNIAEFMALGVPIVCTGYSGNLDFCSAETVGLVEYELIPVGNDEYIFPEGAFWADPNIECAAQQLLDLYENPYRREYLSKNGIEKIQEFNFENAIKNLSEGLRGCT